MDNSIEATTKPPQSVWRYIWHTTELRRRIIVTLLLIVLYRFLQNIPMPGINPDIIRTTITPGSGLYTIAGLISMLSGGSLLNFSVLALGLFPFNSVRNFLPLLIPIVPSLQKRMEQDPRSMSRWFDKWSYYLSIPSGIMVSYNYIKTLNHEGNLFISKGSGVFSIFFFTITTVTILVAGSFFSVWIAELISDYGIKGRGNAILIVSGIIGGLSHEIGSLLSTSKITESVGLYILLFAICIVGVVYLLGGTRNIPIMYPHKSQVFYAIQRDKNVRAPQYSIHLNLPKGDDGLLFSQLLISFVIFLLILVSRIGIPWLNTATLWVIDIFREDSLLFGPVTFFSVVYFTYFISDVGFTQINYGDYLKRQGAQIPGVHSGAATEKYLRRINSRITFASALIFGFLAIAPWIFNIVFDAKLSLLDGGKIIIIVGVVRSIFKNFETEMKLDVQQTLVSENNWNGNHMRTTI